MQQAIVTDRLFGRLDGTWVVEFKAGKITKIQRIQPVEAESICSSANDTVLDLRGYFVLPGLIDSHVHAIATGMLMLVGDVRGVTTLESLQKAIQTEAAKQSKVVRLGGLDRSKLTALELSKLDRGWLDGQEAGRPLFIKSVEGHSAWFNSKAWEHFKIGEVLSKCKVDSASQADMYARGRVHGGAYEELTEPIYDSFVLEERREGMLRVLDLASRKGLTGLHCLEGYGTVRHEDFPMILDLDGRNCDLTLYCRDSDPGLAAELGVKRFGGCWCVDGAIGSHSAALHEPYHDMPGHLGELYFSDAELSQWIESGLSGGMQVCNHVIGDRAVDQALRVYENLAGRYDLQALRPRIDHFILGTREQASRAALLGLCSSMQPSFDNFWGGPEAGYAMRLGQERAMRTNPIRMALEEGMHVAGGSDSYITPLDPLLGIRAAMDHHNPAQRVDGRTAVKLFSEYGAFLAHSETSRGRIEPGYTADFTVIDGPPGAETSSVKVTVFAGKVVYSAL